MATPRFAMQDTRKSDGFYVQFERVIIDDDAADRPDQMQDGFWPSQDPDNAGYVGDCTAEQFAEHQRAAERRMRDYDSGTWNYVGVRARALCFIVCNGVGTHITLESAGLWGIESDSGDDYLDEVYHEEIGQLKNIIAAMSNPTYENGPHPKIGTGLCPVCKHYGSDCTGD